MLLFGSIEVPPSYRAKDCHYERSEVISVL